MQKEYAAPRLIPYTICQNEYSKSHCVNGSAEGRSKTSGDEYKGLGSSDASTDAHDKASGSESSGSSSGDSSARKASEADFLGIWIQEDGCKQYEIRRSCGKLMIYEKTSIIPQLSLFDIQFLYFCNCH